MVSRKVPSLRLQDYVALGFENVFNIFNKRFHQIRIGIRIIEYVTILSLYFFAIE